MKSFPTPVLHEELQESVRASRVKVAKHLSERKMFGTRVSEKIEPTHFVPNISLFFCKFYGYRDKWSLIRRDFHGVLSPNSRTAGLMFVRFLIGGPSFRPTPCWSVLRY